MRKLAIAVGALVALAGGAAMVLPRILNTEEFRAQVRAELETRLGRKVTFDGLGLGIIPPSVSLANVSVPDAPGFSNDPLAKAKRFQLRVALFALLRGQVQVQSLRVEQPSIELFRNAEGVWNYTALGASGGSRDGSQPLTIGKLEMEDGEVAITDLQRKSPRAVYQHINIELSGYGSSKPFRLTASLKLPGAGSQKVQLDGTGIAGGGGFDGKLTLEQASLASLAKFLTAELPGGLDGSATGQTTFRSGKGSVELQGGLDVAGIRAGQRDLGAPVSLRYNIRNSEEVLAIESFEAKIGSVALNASGKVPAKQDIRVRIDMARSPIAELARLGSMAGMGFGKGVEVEGHAEAHILAEGPSDKYALNGSVDLSGLVVTASGWKDPVRVPAIRLALTPEAIRANDFTVQTGATSVQAGFTLSGYANDSGNLDSSIAARDASLEELLRIGKAFGAPEDIGGTGQVSLDVRARGPVKGSLVYSGSGSIRNAQLQVPSLSKPLRVASSQLKFGADSVSLSDVTGSLGTSNFRGAVSLNGFRAPRVDLALSVDKIDVADLAGPPAKPASKGTSKAPIERVTGTGRIEIGSLVNGSLVLDKVRANCSLDKGIVRLDPLTAEIYGGRQSGSIVIDLSSARPKYNVKTKLENVDANRLMTATTALRGIITGAMGGQAEIEFFAGEGDEIAKTLNGKVSFKMASGKIAGSDLLGELSKLGKFLSPLQGASAVSTDIAALEGSMTLKDGLGTTQDLMLQLSGGPQLTASGSINLRDQSIKMRALAVFAKDLADRAGGNRIGGILTSAVMDERGRLVMPALISGTVGKPLLVPDAERIAQMKVRSISEGLTDAIRKGNPGSIIDIFKGKRKQ